jgi:hypothetical protein
MWFWRRLEKIWTDLVKKGVLHRIKEERNILHKIYRSKADWIGHIFCRNCLLIDVTEDKLEE